VRIYDRALDGGEARDIEGPIFQSSSALSAVSLPDPFGLSGKVQTTVFFPATNDPNLPDGTQGTGVDGFTDRYAIGSGPFGQWLTTTQPGFTILETTEGTELLVQVFATDRAGNEGMTRTGRLVVPPAIELPPTEEQEEIAEPEDAVSSTFGFGGIEGEGSLQFKIPQKTDCNGSLHYIHLSKHELLKGRRVVNVGATFWCKGNAIVKGEAMVILLFSPKAEPNKMQFEDESEIRKFNALPPIGPFDLYANRKCRNERGIYHALAYINGFFEPGIFPPYGQAEGATSRANPCL
jgi:hypothetical protein